MITKTCTICQQEKVLSNFFDVLTNGKQYYYSFCKDCSRKKDKQYRERNREATKETLHEKKCSRCKNILSIDNFSIAKWKKDGYKSLCHQCVRDYQRERNEKLLQIPKLQLIEKTCYSCKITKASTDFCKHKNNKDGRNHICKECTKVIARKNMDKIRLSNKKRRHNDPVFRMTINIRRRILFAIKGIQKSANTFSLLGCTGTECMDYLETLFWPGMTRKNHGANGWVIDHIKPIDSFDKTDPNWQYEAFHYTNLQPLWKADNDRKKARLNWTPSESDYELPERLKNTTSNQWDMESALQTPKNPHH